MCVGTSVDGMVLSQCATLTNGYYQPAQYDLGFTHRWLPLCPIL